MNQKHPLDEQKIISLLQKLGMTEVKYPPDLLAHRRAAFLNLVGASALKFPIEGVKPGHSPPTIPHAPMTLATKAAIGILTTTSIALSSYLGILVYENRAQLKNLFQSLLPRVTETAAPLPSFSAPTLNAITLTVLPSETPPPTFTPEPTLTPEATVSLPAADAPSNNPPTPKPKPTDKGKHIGQTPHAPSKH